jgi:magnesium transporter
MTEEERKDINHQSEHQLVGVSGELIQNVIKVLDDKDIAALNQLTEPLHIADVADLIAKLDHDHRRIMLDMIKYRMDPDVLSYLEDHVKDNVLEVLGTDWLAEAMAGLETDDALNIIKDLEVPQQEEILKSISAQDSAMLREAMAYPEDSAGQLMQREVVSVPSFWTVKETLDFIRESDALPDHFYEIYVVDPKHKPIGGIYLDKLLRHKDHIPVSEVMRTDIKTILVTTDQEEAAVLFSHYDLLSAPVVDESSRIVGMITVDDVVDVIEEEAEEDLLHLAGLGESDFHAPVWRTSMSRAQWLVITLINTLIAASVISQFEAAIQEKVALAFLMVIVAAIGGSAGMQTVTVTVRALATQELQDTNYHKALIKELIVAIINGFGFAIVLGLIAGFWLGDIEIGFVLGGAVLCNMLWAAFAGTILPVLVQRIGMDPAISAGPLLSTTTDIIGYAIFLGFASYFLL